MKTHIITLTVLILVLISGTGCVSSEILSGLRGYNGRNVGEARGTNIQSNNRIEKHFHLPSKFQGDPAAIAALVKALGATAGDFTQNVGADTANQESEGGGKLSTPTIPLP